MREAASGSRTLGKRIVTAVWVVLSSVAATKSAMPPVPAVIPSLKPPFELEWGATHDAVANLLGRIFRPKADGPPRVEGAFLSEQQYEGEIFALKADRITAMLVMARLFALAVSFPPTPEAPASLLWSTLVDQVSRDHGPPLTITKPVPLLSWNAVISVIPKEANKSDLLRIFHEAQRDPKVGPYVLQDLQVQVGLWAPQAVWRSEKGEVIKVVMRAGGRNEFGLTAIKPMLFMSKYDMVP